MGDDYSGKQLWLYTVFVVDQLGELVQNADIQCRTDTVCETVNTGNTGFAFFVAETPVEYHLTVLSLPEGYSTYENEEAVTGTESGWFQLNVYKHSR